jgi:hypothetical protein
MIAGAIVLDVRRPGISGLTVLDTLVTQGVDQPVIMLTGHGTVDLCRRAFKAGAAEFLEKPVNDELLLDTLQQAVRRHVKSRQRKHMRNAGAHLSGPDDANALDVHSAPFFVRPNHMRRPGSDARQGGKNSSRIRGPAFRQPGAAKLESRCAVVRVGGMVITCPDDRTLDYLPRQYGKSKLLFRGPQRPLTGPCCAIPGGPALAAALPRGGLHRVSL